MFQGLDLEGLIFSVRDFLADGRLRGQRDDFVRREIPLVQDVQDFAAHVSRGTGNSNACGGAVFCENPVDGGAQRAHHGFDVAFLLLVECADGLAHAAGRQPRQSTAVLHALD